jgi:hypothetical protein
MPLPFVLVTLESSVLGLSVSKSHKMAQGLKRALSNSRVLLPLIHSLVALTLLSFHYLPGWPKWRARDLIEQRFIEAEARAGRWPPSNAMAFELCYFGTPRVIAAMFPAELPAYFVAGVLVIPSNTRDRLLEAAPGRILPSTRMLLFIGIFAAIVGLQWYLMARLTSTAQTSLLWRRIVYFVPIACIPLGLMLPRRWDLFPFLSLPFWIFLATGTALQYRKKRAPALPLDPKLA